MLWVLLSLLASSALVVQLSNMRRPAIDDTASSRDGAVVISYAGLCTA